MIGLYGGTFNPIHFGHLRMAEELVDACQLSEVRFIPSSTPPHKPQPTATPEQRAQMIALAIGDHPKFRLDPQEIQRNGVSYTIDTLSSIRASQGSQTPIAFIMGMDAFAEIEHWHEWQHYLDYAHILVSTRPETYIDQLSTAVKALLSTHLVTDSDALHHQAHGLIYLHQMTPLAISSSQIRRLTNSSQSQRYLLPDTVIEYIHQQGLYLT